MSIRVEFIKRRAGGRVTVRPTIYEKDSVTLGRATDCDVHLPDLRVALRHARIQVLSPERIRVEAIADQRIKADNKIVKRKDFPLQNAPVISIGPYQLQISSDNVDSSLLLRIELVEATTVVGDMRNEKALFTLQGVVPGKRPMTWLLFLAVIIGFLALPVANHIESRKPQTVLTSSEPALLQSSGKSWLAGEMSSAHANLVANCRTCHEAAFQRVSDNVCLECHQQQNHHTDPKIYTSTSPHPTTPDEWLMSLRAALGIAEDRCGSCHFEHNGETGVTPENSSFCTDCHRNLKGRAPDIEIYDVGSFKNFHPEFHPTVSTLDDSGQRISHRPSLATRPKEENGLTFPHDFHLEDPEVARKLETLNPAIKNRWGDTLDCVDCHIIDDAGRYFKPIEMETQCQDCHSLAFSAGDDGKIRSLPHGEPVEVRRVLEDFYFAQASQTLIDDNASSILERQLSAAARQRRLEYQERAIREAKENTDAMVARIFSEDGVCQKCHTNELPSLNQNWAPIAPVELTQRYMPKAEFSHKQHMSGNLECSSCHSAERSSQSADVLMPSITVCRDCHNDDKGKNAIASDCLTCHSFHDENAPPMSPALASRPRLWGNRE